MSKGTRQRPILNKKKFNKEYDRIFGKKSINQPQDKNLKSNEIGIGEIKSKISNTLKTLNEIIESLKQ